jgi:hypothetical protein
MLMNLPKILSMRTEHIGKNYAKGCLARENS